MVSNYYGVCLLKVTELLSKNKNNSFIINIILALAIESVNTDM
jgi:hypothetical protein